MPYSLQQYLPVFGSLITSLSVLIRGALASWVLYWGLSARKGTIMVTPSLSVIHCPNFITRKNYLRKHHLPYHDSSSEKNGCECFQFFCINDDNYPVFKLPHLHNGGPGASAIVCDPTIGGPSDTPIGAGLEAIEPPLSSKPTKGNRSALRTFVKSLPRPNRRCGHPFTNARAQPQT